MSQNDPDKVTFQVTVTQLKVTSRLSEQDIHVTISVDEESKITCSGNISEDGLTVTWNHPFLFAATTLSTIGVAIWALPEELTPEWEKQLLGDKVVANVGSLLESGNQWQYNVPRLSVGPATLSLSCWAHSVLVIPDGHDCLTALERDAIRLYEFGQRFKNIACVSIMIEVNLARLDLCPLGHADHAVILGFLAIGFSSSYIQGGNVSALDRAIEIHQIRLGLCPLGHPSHINALGNLAISLGRQYWIQRNPADLNKLIGIQQKWLGLCPSTHPDYARALGEHALSLWEKYRIQGNMTDLNKAVEMAEKTLDLHPAGHPNHHIALEAVAVYINERYREQGGLADLNRAINLKEKCLELRPSNHPDRGRALHNLAMSFIDCYRKLNRQSDLSRAIELFQDALAAYPVQHHDFPSTVRQLASVVLLPFQSPHSNQPLHPLDEAFETYRLLKKCAPAVSMNLWQTTQAWIQDAEKYNHSSVLEAYQMSLSTLDHFTSLNSSLDSRHEIMQARVPVANLANNAFSCAIRHGDFQLAVELLEQGRGILWNQLASFDVSFSALESESRQGHDLGRKLTRLSADLKKHAQGGGGTGAYWRVREEWQSVVDKIRRIDGFSRFLLPPHFDDLRQAAEQGPVIIVNACKYACDALIVLYTGSPVHVRLPCSLGDVIQLCSQLSELTHDPHAFGDNRESWVKRLLRELWDSVVEPIADVLQNDLEVPPGSRIWWCPTSKFTVLPLHAAGPHRKTEKNLMDIYVSSYAPSLSALIRARDRARAHKEAHDASGTAKVVSFAAVGQGEPSKETGLIELPEVEFEIDKIHNETDMPLDVKFESVVGGAATIEGAVQAFRDHRWVHVACHGAQHPEKPFESWFAMGDGKLTLMRIIQERYIDSDFAFLSACHTAVGDASTPDEVIHLAAGMQFAGFNGVVGTLWKVDDSVAHQVVTQFYKEMFKRPVIDFENAAVALNRAALQTAEEVSLEKRVVFVHIGI